MRYPNIKSFDSTALKPLLIMMIRFLVMRKCFHLSSRQVWCCVLSFAAAAPFESLNVFGSLPGHKTARQKKSEEQTNKKILQSVRVFNFETSNISLVKSRLYVQSKHFHTKHCHWMQLLQSSIFVQRGSIVGSNVLQSLLLKHYLIEWVKITSCFHSLYAASLFWNVTYLDLLPTTKKHSHFFFLASTCYFNFLLIVLLYYQSFFNHHLQS